MRNDAVRLPFSKRRQDTKIGGPVAKDPARPIMPIGLDAAEHFAGVTDVLAHKQGDAANCRHLESLSPAAKKFHYQLVLSRVTFRIYRIVTSLRHNSRHFYKL